MSQQPQWVFDQNARQYYWYRAQDDTMVYQDGRQIRRAQDVPRTQQTRPPDPASLASLALQAGLSTSPPRGDASYTLANSMGNLSLGNPSSPAFQPRDYKPVPVQGQISERHGIRVIEAVNVNNGVRTVIGTSPYQKFTDPTLLREGVRAHRVLYGTEGADELLYSKFRIRKGDFFTSGRVFWVLWSEPMGEGSAITSFEPNDRTDPGMSIGRHGERVYSKVRRFVVIRASEKYCSALPIVSYGKRGVSKPGVKKNEHAIIYTGERAPQPLPEELPQRGEAGMRSRPVRVVVDDPTEKLDDRSRLDFGKVHTIQHNLKVAPFGNVHPRSQEAFETQFNSVWIRQAESAMASSSRTQPDPAMPAPARGTSGQALRPTRSGDNSSSYSQPSVYRPTTAEVDDQGSDGNNSRSVGRAQSSSAERERAHRGAVQQEQSRLQQAQQLKSALTALMHQRMTREQAVETVVQQWTSRGYSREGASALIRTLLAQGSNVVARRPSEAQEADRQDDGEGASSNEGSDGE